MGKVLLRKNESNLPDWDSIGGSLILQYALETQDFTNKVLQKPAFESINAVLYRD